MFDIERYVRSNKCNDLDAKYLVENYFKPLEKPANGKILDVGCGAGSTSAIIMESIPVSWKSFLGIDISEGMIKHAKQNYGSKDDKIQFLTLDGMNILNLNMKFQKFFQLLYDVLENGGELFMLVPSPDMFVFTAWKELCEDKNWSKYIDTAFNFIPPSRDDMIKYAKNADFANIQCDCVNRSTVYSNVDHIKHFLQSVNPYLNQFIPKEYHDEYMNQFMEISFRESVNNNGILLINGKADWVRNVLCFYAKKV